MYENGQPLMYDADFSQHMQHDIPIQIYYSERHSDIGFVEKVSPQYIKVNNTFYRRDCYTFISRPGY